MKRHSFLLIVIAIGAQSLFAQEKLMTNAYNRMTTSLNGYWKYIVDPYENGYYNLPNFTSVTFDPNIALQYMKDTDESVLYRFIIPAGFKLLFVEAFNEGKKNLLEFILPKNTKVYINKGIIKKDIYDINNICPKLNKTLKILDINVLL